MRAPALRVNGSSQLTNRQSPRRTGQSALAAELREWCSYETADWEALVEGEGTGTGIHGSDSDLWESMPTLDSKTVARTSPIFEKHLGRPLKVRLIRPGGYDSVDDMVNHLVPAMMGLAETNALRLVKKEEP